MNKCKMHIVLKNTCIQLKSIFHILTSNLEKELKFVVDLIPWCIKIMVYYSFVFILEYNQINITHFYDKL